LATPNPSDDGRCGDVTGSSFWLAGFVARDPDRPGLRHLETEAGMILAAFFSAFQRRSLEL
jgi:hypothetical protein